MFSVEHNLNFVITEVVKLFDLLSGSLKANIKVSAIEFVFVFTKALLMAKVTN